ncbi:MAG: FtsW/RodA/SpoVE family cell cycle protein [Rikenellaceae bacterium]
MSVQREFKERVQGRVKEYMPSRMIAGDRILWVIITILAVVSVLVVYSSTAKMAYDPAAIRTTSHFLGRQLFFLAVSAGVILVCHHINSRFYRAAAFPFYVLALVLTFITLFFGSSTNGAARWINIVGFQFQPSEMLKVMTLVLLAKQLAQRQESIKGIEILPNFKFKARTTFGQIAEFWRSGFVQILGPVVMACAVILPAHTSSSLLLFASSFVMLAIARVPSRQLLKLVGWGAALALSYTIIGAGRSETAGNRVTQWVDIWTQDRTHIPVEELSDTERSMIAIHDGGLVGLGAGRSAMRVEMIHPESDYAFAFFVEEYGLLLSIVLLLLYLCIFFRSIEIFKLCSSRFSALLVLGLGMMITLQALSHIAVSINLIPETGQTLPLISRGGSAMIFNAMALAIILSVSRQTEEHSHS